MRAVRVRVVQTTTKYYDELTRLSVEEFKAFQEDGTLPDDIRGMALSNEPTNIQVTEEAYEIDFEGNREVTGRWVDHGREGGPLVLSRLSDVLRLIRSIIKDDEMLKDTEEERLLEVGRLYLNIYEE